MNKAVGFVPASLQNSAYRNGEKSLSGQATSYGWEERCGSSPRIATAALDDLLDHPEAVL
jgi:hypothetical protein